MSLVTQISDLLKNNSKADEFANQGMGFKYLIDMLGLGNDSKPTNSTAHLFNDIYACVNVLSDDVAKLPIHVYRKQNGVITHESGHNIQYLLGVRPNPYMTPYVFKKMAMTDLCFTGNFYALKEYDKNGKTIALHPLTSTQTQVVVDKDTRQFYYQTTVGGNLRHLQPDEVIHVKGLSRDGYVGISPIRVIAEQSQSNRTAVRLNQAIMESGGTPQGILKIATHISPEARENIKKSWKEKNSSDAIAVLDSGLDYQQIGISPADMQFLEAQKFNQQQIAAVYKVPLHKINQLDHATYTNIESQSLDYVKNTLQPWVVQFEEELSYKLFLDIEEDKDCYIKFNLDSELRGDSKSRAEVQEIYIRSGVKTINEIRALNEDSPYTIENADIPLMTLNYTRLDWMEKFIENQVNKNGLGQAKGGEEDEEGSTDGNDNI